MKLEKRNWLDLFKANPPHAWDIFLRRYNQLIIAAIEKLVLDHDDRMELYTFVLEHLKNDDCHKLTSYFTQSRHYNFETWIAVIVRNCCMDWFRKQKGRNRLLKFINELSEIEQHIFRYLYQYGYSREEIYQLLKTRHGYKKSVDDLVNVIDKIDDLIQKNIKWKYKRDLRYFIIPLTEEKLDKYNSKHHFLNTDLNPEQKIIAKDSIQLLNDALRSLPHENQLIIQLYYFKGLTLEKIARILKMKNIWQVQRRLKKTLKQLKSKLRDKGIDLSDLDI
jgi:RNA polymerase sigma factor (sigma-70 family)